MQSLVIVILLLSLIGFYINLNSNHKLKEPEFNKETEEENVETKEGEGCRELSDLERERERDRQAELHDTVDFAITNNLQNNSIHDIVELTKREKAYDINYDNILPSDRKENKFGIADHSLSHENNFPYDHKMLKSVDAENIYNSKRNVVARRNPEAAMIGYARRAPSGEHWHGVEFTKTNKNISEKLIKYRNNNLLDHNQKEIRDPRKENSNRLIPNPVKSIIKPDSRGIDSQRNSYLANQRLNSTHSETEHMIKEMKSNYNFK